LFSQISGVKVGVMLLRKLYFIAFPFFFFTNKKKLRKRLHRIEKNIIFAASLVSPWGKAGGLIL